MATNLYKNKVIYNGTTLIDLTDTTAVADDVAQGKYFYTADGQKTAGALIDGDLLGYGGETIAVVGEGLAGYAIMGEATLPSMGTAVAGLTVVGG